MGCGSKILKRIINGNNKRDKKSTPAEEKSSILVPRIPLKCHNCGASVNGKKVNWTGPTSIECSFCGSTLQVELERVN
jgi:hypothetical protein